MGDFLMVFSYWAIYFFVIIGGIIFYVKQKRANKSSFLSFAAVTVSGAWMTHLPYLIVLMLPLLLWEKNYKDTNDFLLHFTTWEMLIPLLVTGLILLFNLIYSKRKKRPVNKHCLAWFIVTTAWTVLTSVLFQSVYIGFNYFYWDFP